MKGDATIEVSSQAGAITIPVEALFSEGGTDYVYVVENGKLKKVEITVGATTDTDVEVVEGLEEGQTVALSGLHAVQRRDDRSRQEPIGAGDTDEPRRDPRRSARPPGTPVRRALVCSRPSTSPSRTTSTRSRSGRSAALNVQRVRGRDARHHGPVGFGQVHAHAHRRAARHPTSGMVTVEGEDVSDMAPNQLAAVRNKRIGFVFQAFNLLPRTTARPTSSCR